MIACHDNLRGTRKTEDAIFRFVEIAYFRTDLITMDFLV